MKEKIIKINGEKTNYTVTTDGDIYSLNYARTGKKKKLKPLKREKRGGYMYVNLHHNGKLYALPVHRLVAMHFIKNKHNKPEVNHKNGNKEDNRVKNLEWATSKENTDHAFKTGLRSVHYGNDAPYKKIKEKTAIKICEMLEENKYGMTEIAEIVGVPASIVVNIKNKKAWVHVSENYDIEKHDKRSKPVKHKKKEGIKITEKCAKTICEYLQNTSFSVKEISEITGVNKYKINSILYGYRWKKVSCNYDFSKRRKR